MLTRFDEEIRQGSGTLDAVWVALSRAGRVVFVSGVTLGLTNGGLHASLRPREFVCEAVRQCM